MKKRFRIFIDEVGNTDLKIALSNENERHLSLSGVVISSADYYEIFIPAFKDLKRAFFKREDVVFHRREILYGRADFQALKDASLRRDFDRSLLVLIKELPYKLITAVVDKKVFFERSRRDDPYHAAFLSVLDVYITWLNNNDFCGDVNVEQRDKRQDRGLKLIFEAAFKDGDRAAKMQNCLTSSSIKFINKQDNCPATQLADLLANPSAKGIRGHLTDGQRNQRFTDQVSAVLEAGKYLSPAAKILLP